MPGKSRQGVFVCGKRWGPERPDNNRGTEDRSLIKCAQAAPAIDLQPLATNPYVRWWYDNSLLSWSIRDRFNSPRPAEVSTFVEGPSCATAFPDFHSPVIAVGRNCEHKRDRCRNHHSAEHSNQKYASHFTFNVAAIGLLLPLRVRQILLCHSGAVLCSLFCTSVIPILPLLQRIEARHQAGSLLQLLIDAVSMCKR
jgi:hypothetical protein